jgi:dUTPase
MAQFEVTDAMESPRRATTGSAGVDLCSTTQLVLTPRMRVQLVDTDFKGPLPADTVGLILGRSSVTMRGLIVHSGVIDYRKG